MATDRQLDESNNVMVALLVSALKANLDDEALPAGARESCAQEFLDFLGRLFSLLESAQPTAAKGAALLYVVQRLGLAESQQADAQLMLTLVGAMEQIQAGFNAAKPSRPVANG